MDKRPRSAISATELMAERDRRMRDDPDYRAQVERVEAERAEGTRQSREAEQPIVRDLASIGIDVDSVWDLYKTPDAAPKAVPVLLSHLARGYPDRVVDGIGSALGNKSARAHRLAAVMSGCAVKTHYQDLLSFVGSDALGATRIYFLRPINRIGNRISPGAGRTVISSFADHPTMGKEARAILAGRGPNE